MKPVTYLFICLFSIYTFACKQVKGDIFLLPLVTGSIETSLNTGQTTIDTTATSTIDSSTVPPVLSGNIQSNSVSLTASTNYTLSSSVSSGSSFVTCSYQTSSSNVENTPSCQLSNDGSQVLIAKSGGASITVNYSVLSFSSGMSVQRGASTFTSGLASVTLPTAINPQRSFLVLSTRTSETGNVLDARKLAKGEITNANTLNFSCYQCTASTIVEWQVIQWNASSVQSGQTTIANGNANQSVTLASSVDTTKSFLIFNYSYTPGATPGFEDEYMLEGRFLSNSQINFQRGNTTGVLDIQYFVVSLSSGATVKSNSYSMTDAQLNICDSIPSGGLTNYQRTMLLASNRIGIENPVASNVDSGSIRYGFGTAGCGGAGNTHLSATRAALGEGPTNHSISGSYFLIEF
ncbi:hypothetical protein LPTSP4_21000 [Leptospira ryugenii]|uniref:Uncharacterized protein n=1 Tax=Leptospira ryugenii TaxID=1917863 RepID=A0A2P2E123_9LEPT|nr:hypothetical protein [Leptospira ryugenii]GBF50574.1 hypothetical protein LPTSP4_21000 [Leptospira ryugenii]